MTTVFDGQVFELSNEEDDLCPIVNGMVAPILGEFDGDTDETAPWWVD